MRNDVIYWHICVHVYVTYVFLSFSFLPHPSCHLPWWEWKRKRDKKSEKGEERQEENMFYKLVRNWQEE